MPQLVKGGKWIFGLSEVGLSGRIAVPREAADEYGFSPGDALIAMSGSRTSGGFVLTSLILLEKTGFEAIHRKAVDLSHAGDQAVKAGNRWLAGAVMRTDLSIGLTPEILDRYGVKPGDQLAAGRGSWAGIAFLVRGRIVEECLSHPELTVFRAEK